MLSAMSDAQLPAKQITISTATISATALIGVVCTALVITLFGSTFATLVTLWERDANYSHGYLIAPISLVLGIRIYRRVGPPLQSEIAFGILGIVLGVLLQSAAVIGRWPPLSYLGLVCVLRGTLVCAGGRAWAAKFNFPLLFLFFMFPVPVTWTGYASLWLQDIVARVSETVISSFVVCHRVGHTIRIAGVDQSLVVAQECSGLGQIVSFLAFSALLGHLIARPMWHRIILIVASVPVAIASNTLRVVLMNLGAVWFGTNWMGGVLHDAPALFSIPVGIAFFLFIDHVLSGLVGVPDRAAQNLPATGQPAPGSTPRRGLTIAATILIAGVVSQFALASHIQVAGELSYPHLIGRFESLPQKITCGESSWIAKDQTEATEATKAKLPFHADDLLIRTYQNRQGAVVRLYMVHSRAGEDRKHHPEICIRDVSGAPEDLSFRKTVPLVADGSAEAQRFRFLTGSARSVVVYYWHYTLTPIPTSGQTRLQALHQRIGVSAPSVTVQVSTNTNDPATLDSIEALLQELDLAARMRVLPPHTTTGCNRIPISLARD
jgi:exosortase